MYFRHHSALADFLMDSQTPNGLTDLPVPSPTPLLASLHVGMGMKYEAVDVPLLLVQKELSTDVLKFCLMSITVLTKLHSTHNT